MCTSDTVMAYMFTAITKPKNKENCGRLVTFRKRGTPRHWAQLGRFLQYFFVMIEDSGSRGGGDPCMAASALGSRWSHFLSKRLDPYISGGLVGAWFVIDKRGAGAMLGRSMPIENLGGGGSEGSDGEDDDESAFISSKLSVMVSSGAPPTVA